MGQGSRDIFPSFSLPGFMNFKPFGFGPFFVVNIKFGLFFGPSTQPLSFRWFETSPFWPLQSEEPFVGVMLKRFFFFFFFLFREPSVAQAKLHPAGESHIDFLSNGSQAGGPWINSLSQGPVDGELHPTHLRNPEKSDSEPRKKSQATVAS